MQRHVMRAPFPTSSSHQAGLLQNNLNYHKILKTREKKESLWIVAHFLASREHEIGRGHGKIYPTNLPIRS